MKTILTALAIGFAFPAPPAWAELPPSEVSMQEAFTAEEEAARALARVSGIYRELISLQDNITDKEKAAAAAPRIRELQRQLHKIEGHQKANPDFREAIVRYLSRHPELIRQLQDEEIRYRLSAQKLREAGLLD